MIRQKLISQKKPNVLEDVELLKFVSHINRQAVYNVVPLLKSATIISLREDSVTFKDLQRQLVPENVGSCFDLVRFGIKKYGEQKFPYNIFNIKGSMPPVFNVHNYMLIVPADVPETDILKMINNMENHQMLLWDITFGECVPVIERMPLRNTEFASSSMKPKVDLISFYPGRSIAVKKVGKYFLFLKLIDISNSRPLWELSKVHQYNGEEDIIDIEDDPEIEQLINRV